MIEPQAKPRHMKTLALTALALMMSAGALYAQDAPMKSKPPAERTEWSVQQNKLKSELAATQTKVKVKLDKVEAKLAAAGEEAKPKLDAARTELKQAWTDLDKALNSVGTATSETWTEVSKAATATEEKAKATLDRHKDDAADAKTPDLKQNTDLK